jgi:hypothetical protein
MPLQKHPTRNSPEKKPTLIPEDERTLIPHKNRKQIHGLFSKAGRGSPGSHKVTVSASAKNYREALEVIAAAVEKSERAGRNATFVITFTASANKRKSASAKEPSIADALSSARARGDELVATILSRDDMLSAHDFAQALGVTRATVNTKRQNRQLLALEGAKRGFRFPVWQIGRDGKPFDAIPALFERLGDSPWAVYRFLVQHHPELDGLTGREALQAGQSAEAVEAAENVAEGFA